MLPQPMVDPELLTMPMLVLCNKLAMQCWLTTLILPWCLHWVKLLWMISLSTFFFMTLGYLDWVWVERMRMDLVLLICGENRHAKTDVCIIDWSHNDILLLVQEDKKLGRGRHAQAQLVAEAIVTFHKNNVHREAVGLAWFYKLLQKQKQTLPNWTKKISLMQFFLRTMTPWFTGLAVSYTCTYLSCSTFSQSNFVEAMSKKSAIKSLF